MASAQLEPFGEPIAATPCQPQELPAMPAVPSRLALRLGAGLFWTLVVGIVAARVAFFDPTSLERIGLLAKLIVLTKDFA